MHTELAKGVYGVGIVDWGIRHFHGFELSTHRGTTYNSYLIVDEKTVLIDTVLEPYHQELLANIRAIMDPAKIDIIVTNHCEADHSGGLPALLRHCPNATLVVSKRGQESVPGHYHAPWRLHGVKTGDRMSIGRNELVFIEAPMLHWPDSMFTYLTGHNILMSNDAFGQHYASAFRFNDQVDQAELFEEALKYYTNILTPFSNQVTKKIDEVLALNLPVSMIAPSHGVIWRRDPLQIVTKYQEWASQKPEPRAIIVYDTMWEATRRMAHAIGDGILQTGTDCKIFHGTISDQNDLMVEMFKARAILIGSPTHNGGLLPSIMPIIEDMKGLKFKNKIGAAFGSYGWSGESVKQIEQHFKDAQIPLAREGIKVKWQPSAADLEACCAFGKSVAEAMKNA